jgi:hypothetical protein
MAETNVPVGQHLLPRQLWRFANFGAVTIFALLLFAIDVIFKLTIKLSPAGAARFQAQEAI